MSMKIMKLLTLMAISFGFLTAAYSSSAVSVGCMTEEATVFASELSGQSFAVIVPASAIQDWKKAKTTMRI